MWTCGYRFSQFLSWYLPSISTAVGWQTKYSTWDFFAVQRWGNYCDGGEIRYQRWACQACYVEGHLECLSSMSHSAWLRWWLGVRQHQALMAWPMATQTLPVPLSSPVMGLIPGPWQLSVCPVICGSPSNSNFGMVVVSLSSWLTNILRFHRKHPLLD